MTTFGSNQSLWVGSDYVLDLIRCVADQCMIESDILDTFTFIELSLKSGHVMQVLI